MKTILAFSLLLLLFSCKKSDTGSINLDILNSPDYSTPLLQILITDAKGNDLLDPSNPNAIVQKDVSLTYVKNDGTKVPNYNCSNCQINNVNEGAIHFNYIMLSCSYTNLLRLSESRTDTISCEFFGSYPHGQVKSVKLNGKSVPFITTRPISLGITIVIE